MDLLPLSEGISENIIHLDDMPNLKIIHSFVINKIQVAMMYTSCQRYLKNSEFFALEEFVDVHTNYKDT